MLVAAPGAQQCLVSLREQGHRLAIVTNGSSQQQQAKIDALGLRSLVDGVCVSGELGIKKPDARLFQAAADATSTTLDGMGDSPHHDVGGADRLGVSTVWIRRGRPWTEAGYEPTITIDSLAELPRAIGA